MADCTSARDGSAKGRLSREHGVANVAGNFCAGAIVVSIRHDSDRSGDLTFTLFRDIDPNLKKDWLVHNIIGAGELSGWFGNPGSGKSLIVGDLGFHIAAGKKWFNRITTHGAVLYVAAERAEVVKRRMAALKLHYGIDDIPLATVTGPADLRTSPRHADEIIGHAGRLTALFGVPVVLVIVETINRVMAGGDENSSKDMGRLIATLSKIQHATNAHVLAVHHTPLEGMRMRGHQSLEGACDVTLKIEKRNEQYRATVAKVNDGPEGHYVAYGIELLDLDHDVDTGVITVAPVVTPIASGDKDAADSDKSKRKPKLSANAQTMLGIVEDAGRRGLNVADWYNKARELDIGVKRRADLTDIRRALEKHELISVDEAETVRILRPFNPIHDAVALRVTGAKAPP